MVFGAGILLDLAARGVVRHWFLLDSEVTHQLGAQGQTRGAHDLDRGEVVGRQKKNVKLSTS